MRTCSAASCEKDRTACQCDFEPERTKATARTMNWLHSSAVTVNGREARGQSGLDMSDRAHAEGEDPRTCKS